MQLTGLLDVLRETAVYRDLLARLQNDHAADSSLIVVRSARPYLLAALAHDWNGPVVYITARARRAYNVAEQLPVWLADESRIFRFAEPAVQFYERVPWDREVIHNRIETLAALMPPEESAAELALPQPVVVASARALMQRTLAVNHFRSGSMVLERGQRHTIDRLIGQWVGTGYEGVSVVTEPGTFSRRGGILDVYPVADALPVRIEFFGDEIDSLRQFDPSTQRTITPLKRVGITPARETLPQDAPPLVAHLSDWFRSLPEAEEELSGGLADGDALGAGTTFPYIEHYLPYLYPNPVSLLDYAPQDALVVVEAPDELADTVAEIAAEAEQNRAEKHAANQLPPDYPTPYLDWDTLETALNERTVLRLSNVAEDEDLPADRLFVPGERFGGQLRPLLSKARGLRGQGARIIIVTQQAARLTDIWYEQDSSAFVPTMDDVTETPMRSSLAFVSGTLQEGWTLRAETGDLHLLTDAEIFGWSRPEPRRRKGVKPARVPEASYADWTVGDHVVHVDYGIGRFAGMARRTIEGNEREYLLVEYEGTDRLYVPIHQADRLTRYVGKDEKPPALNKLGSPVDWLRVRRKAQKAVEEEARELLALYARRAQTSGFPFTPDSHWQHELEASFPYVETDDQLRALREVKADMEKETPMDRLICGDVGYGKTEVALRAAFKAVMDGKQVAVLVPTTVLAQQHYETFSQRLLPFPVQVEVVSRFRTREEQSRLLPKLAAGEIDIIIGTHRLLSDDITFHDLGLVIIDEEQRFGVKHKEHFKKLRAQVDVITLTATPIPRTMYMGLTGARDISMIQTPPEERLPVITHVRTFDERLVRQAVLREMDRGGQVFYVHNRVRSIDTVQERLERIVPEAKTVVAHGQMNPRYLEKVMSEFAHGHYDILVSTSIIENGIDIPNVNTLIVDRADWFGMSQLYQLRGRVGRGAQQAYAYFFHSGGGKLTEEARVRLDALAEHTDLGAGFQIAMRDLELRGAGDILSTRQTGHVAAVGLHLYTQLLTQAIRELKGGESSLPAPAAATERIVIDLPLPAYLPNDWIPELALRLQIYRRISELHTPEDVDLMRDELRDRFGQLPAAVEGLLYQMDVKLLAQKTNATAVIKPQERIQVKLPYLPNIDRRRLEAELGAGITVTRTAVEIDSDETWQLHLLDVLGRLAKNVEEAGTML